MDPKYYQRVTSHTYGAILVGRFLAGISSQVVIKITGILNYWNVNFITLAFEAVGLVVALSLPSVQHSIYFHRSEEPGAVDRDPQHQKTTWVGGYLKAYRYLWNDFISAYSNWYVVKWSLWWAVAACGCMQVTGYIQLLWNDVAYTKDEAEKYNGYVDAAHTLLS